MTLGVNFRNTRAIAGYLGSRVAGGSAPFSRSPAVEPPVFHAQPRSPISPIAQAPFDA